MKASVVIDCFPESARRYRRGYAIVVVDVIRATTSIATAVCMGRRCFPVPSAEAAQAVSARLRHPLLAGEVGGEVPEGFEMGNSPAELSLRTDIDRPLVLLSSSGTRLIHEARQSHAVYAGSLRNFSYLARYLAGRHERVAVIGAGSRGQFREEDQMCCGWIAAELLRFGYAPETQATSEVIERWKAQRPAAGLFGASAHYLERTGQIRDLEFILSHIDDLDAAFILHHDEFIMRRSNERDFAFLAPAAWRVADGFVRAR